MKWPWDKARVNAIQEAIDGYDEEREPERKRVEKRLKDVESEVAAMRDAIEAELHRAVSR